MLVRGACGGPGFIAYFSISVEIRLIRLATLVSHLLGLVPQRTVTFMGVICKKEGCDSVRVSRSRYCIEHERERVRFASRKSRRRGQSFKCVEGYLSEASSKMSDAQLDLKSAYACLAELKKLYGRGKKGEVNE